MNKQEKPILYNSSTEKLIININGEKPPKRESYCCLNCGWYFIKVACAFFKKKTVQMILSWVIVLLKM